MNDEVLMTHRHEDTEEPMRAVDDDRIDGLRVREYACGCGFNAAVLSHVEDEDQGVSWPYMLRTASTLA